VSLHESEAVILRCWPVNEADLVVSFFTREFGKVKGVAKSGLKSRKRFGGALEPMTQARAWFAVKPKQELVRLDQLELERSPLAGQVDYARTAVLSFYAEVLDEALPEHDPQETVFRLLAAVLEATTVEQPWLPVTYFGLWMTRLMGWLPELGVCTACGEALKAGEASFHPGADGLFCSLHRQGAGMVLDVDSWTVAQRMLRAPVTAFQGEPWPRKRAQALRRFTWQALERHLERRLRTVDAMRQLGA